MSKTLSFLWRLYKVFLLLISFVIVEVLIFTIGKITWEREFPYLSGRLLKWSVLHMAAVYGVIAVIIFSFLFKYAAVEPLLGWISARRSALEKERHLSRYCFLKGGKR